METIKYDQLVDAKGLACPMPIIRTKKAMNELEAGKVLQVLATDKGSTADLKAWAQSIGHQYLGTVEAEDVLKHYLRKSSETEDYEIKHPHVLDNALLPSRLEKENVILLDVREEAEYIFEHIPGAISIPLGVLDLRLEELNAEAEVYIICRTGSRSDLAANKLTQAGFQKVINVVPGMSTWTGGTTNYVG